MTITDERVESAIEAELVRQYEAALGWEEAKDVIEGMDVRAIARAALEAARPADPPVSEELRALSERLTMVLALIDGREDDATIEVEADVLRLIHRVVRSLLARQPQPGEIK